MASIYVYLIEEIRDKPEFKEVKETSYDWTNYYFRGMKLNREKEEFSISISHVEDDIPEIVRDVVKRVSLHDWQPQGISRRLYGRYSHESAEAIVDVQHSEKNKGWSIRINGQNLKDVRELYYKIRSGQILPFEEWETPQITKPIEGPGESKKQRFLKRFFRR